MVASYQGKLQSVTRESYPHVEQFMSRSFVTVTPDTDIYLAMDLILGRSSSAAMVVDSEKEKNLLGIVSEKDMLRIVTQNSYENESHGGPVSLFMTEHDKIISVTPHTGLNEVAQHFLDYPFKKIPVLEDTRLVGIVRRWDVLRVVCDFHKKRLKYMKQAATSH